jgi:hypothetical protein
VVLILLLVVRKVPNPHVHASPVSIPGVIPTLIETLLVPMLRVPFAHVRDLLLALFRVALALRSNSLLAARPQHFGGDLKAREIVAAPRRVPQYPE